MYTSLAGNREQGNKPIYPLSCNGFSCSLSPENNPLPVPCPAQKGVPHAQSIEPDLVLHPPGPVRRGSYHEPWPAPDYRPCARSGPSRPLHRTRHPAWRAIRRLVPVLRRRSLSGSTSATCTACWTRHRPAQLRPVVLPQRECHQVEANRRCSAAAWQCLSAGVIAAVLPLRRNCSAAQNLTAQPHTPQEIILPEGLTPIAALPSDHPAALSPPARLRPPVPPGHLGRELLRLVHGLPPCATNRIVIPVYRPAQLFSAQRRAPLVLGGWQARLVPGYEVLGGSDAKYLSRGRHAEVGTALRPAFGDRDQASLRGRRTC